MSGTSMAAPHVAGAAALYLQGTPGASPQQVRDGLYALTTKNIVTDARSANAHLLFSNL
jgi:subtilisin family serine protease